MSDLEDRLAVLETKEEIRAFVMQYCRRVDSLSAEDAMQLFTPDCVMRNATGTIEGRDAIGAYYRDVFARSGPLSRHHVMNQVITVESPDRVKHQAYFIACIGAGDVSRLVFGNYDDTIVRTDDGWRYQEKVNDIVLATTADAGWAAAALAPKA